MSFIFVCCVISGWREKGIGLAAVVCTVATMGQKHLHAYILYMVVYKYTKSVHDLISTKKPRILL